MYETLRRMLWSYYNFAANSNIIYTRFIGHYASYVLYVVFSQITSCASNRTGFDHKLLEGRSAGRTTREKAYSWTRFYPVTRRNLMKLPFVMSMLFIGEIHGRWENRMMLAAPSLIKVGSENRSIGVVHLKATLTLMWYSSFFFKEKIIYMHTWRILNIWIAKKVKHLIYVNVWEI